MSQPIGIWLKNLAIINSGLNGPTGNGNEFQAGQWGPGQPLLNSNSSFNNPIYYLRLNTANEPAVLNGSGQVTTDNSTSPFNAYTGTSPGVNSRQYFASVPVSIATSTLDSLQSDNLTITQQARLLVSLRSQPLQLAQISAIEELLTAPRLTSTSHIAVGLHLLNYYHLQHDQANVVRLRIWFNQQDVADKGELAAYLRLTEVLNDMESFLPGVRPLAINDQERLRQVAISGTTSARPACQLLRAYEPACACVLPAADQAIRDVRPTAPLGIAPHAQLAAYPNPASTVLHVPYTLPVGTTAAELLAYDALGRVVLRLAVSAQQGELHLATQTWPAGLYQLALVAGGRVVGTQRVVITSY